MERLIPGADAPNIFEYNEQVRAELRRILSGLSPDEAIEETLDGERSMVERHWASMTPVRTVAELVAFRNGFKIGGRR